MAYGSKKAGTQDTKPATDCGAHAAFAKATSPESVKKMASGATKYKYREA